MRYLESVSPIDILRAGDRKCPEFCDEFLAFLIYLKRNKGEFDTNIDLADLKYFERNHPKWNKFLIRHGFLVIEEEFYKCGQRFRNKENEKEYILASCGHHLVSLINLSSGHYYYGPTIVKSKLKITEEEFNEITHHNRNFELIEKN